MMALLERQEQVHQHTGYVHWQENGTIKATKQDPIPTLTPCHHIKMAKWPTARSVSIKKLEMDYGASQFHEAFAQFVIQWQQPGIRQVHLDYEIQGVHLPFISISTYHQIKFLQASDNGDCESIADIIHTQPACIDAHRKPSLKSIHSRFDTVLVHSGKQGDTGVQGKLTKRVQLSVLTDHCYHVSPSCSASTHCIYHQSHGQRAFVPSQQSTTRTFGIC